MRSLLVMVTMCPAMAAAQVAIKSAPVETAGNLRVSVTCADFNATPTKGLELTVDGMAAKPLGVNTNVVTYRVTDFTTWQDGVNSKVVDTDVGFRVEPGRHHVEVGAPGCVRRAVDVVAVADHAEVILGRLDLTDHELAGNAVAPNGHGVVLGTMLIAGIHGPASGPPRYVYDSHAGYGGWIGLGFAKRGLALALDFAFTTNSVDGMTVDEGGGSQFTGQEYRVTTQVRAGKRFAYRDFAFGVGTGLGLDSWLMKGKFYGPDGVSPQADASWFLPMWTTVTYKPDCDWGIQALTQYDFHPTSSDSNGFTFGAGLLLEPNAACRQQPHMRVTPLD